jgi:DNA-directed RNA polymerase subunit N (RpoN/RPB10)
VIFQTHTHHSVVLRIGTVTAAQAPTYHSTWTFVPSNPLFEVVPMPVLVRCDVCGKVFNSRYVKSHKRLAHPEDKAVSAAERKQMKKILKLYKTLSAENKKSVLALLAAAQPQ